MASGWEMLGVDSQILELPDASLYDALHIWTFGQGGSRFVRHDSRFEREWAASKLQLRMALRQAKRFVLDDDFVRAAVRQAAVQPQKMLNLMHLANLPFDKCWFEYSNDARVAMQAELGSGEATTDKLGPAGVLMERVHPDNPGAYRISHAGLVADQIVQGALAVDPDCPIAPAGFIIDTAGLNPYLHKAENSPLNVDMDTPAVRNMEAMMRGMGWGYFKPGTDPRTLQYNAGEELMRRGGFKLEQRFFSILCAIAVRADVLNKEKTVSPGSASHNLLQHFRNDVMESRGNLRFYTAVLAMINNCPITYKHRPAKGFMRARLRNVPYLDSHTVTIHADSARVHTIVDRAIKAEISRHNKRHDVRGHWALAEYGHGGRACRHEPVERDGAYALCGKCAKLIVWRDHYERGDASLGFVQHNYEVRR